MLRNYRIACIAKRFSHVPAATVKARHIFRIRRRADRIARRKNSDLDIVRFARDLNVFNAQATSARLSMTPVKIRPYLSEKTEQVGFDVHYTYHTAWAARVLSETRPNLHYDVGSHLMFVAVCSGFVPIEHYDYRRPNLQLSQLKTGVVDLTCLPWKSNSIASLSCMHTLEHVGLGRYGDSIDAVGDSTAMNELQRVVSPQGQLLVVVPVGGVETSVDFNAHRVYAYQDVIQRFSQMKLKEFSLIDEKLSPHLTRHADPELVKKLEYGCGCFHLYKP